MVLKEVSNESEYKRVMNFIMELQQQHVILFPQLFRDYGDYTNFQQLMEKYEKEEDIKRLEQCLDTFFCFEHENKVVGCALVQDKIRKDELAFTDSNQLFVTSFIIDSNYRNQGFGKVFFNLLKDWAKQKGYQRMELSVAHQNHLAITLYENMGFQKEMLYMSCEL